MKKVLTLLLTFVMVLSLAACVNNPQTTTGSKNDPTTKPSTGATTKPTTAPTVPTTAPTEPDHGDENAIVLVDNDNFTLKLLSIASDADAYTMNVYVENKTAALLSFSINNISANDYVCPDIFVFWDLEGQKNVTDVISIDRAILDRNGIADPTKVEFYLSVMNGQTWEEIFTNTCVIYPQGEDNHVDDGGYTAKDGDTVLVDNEHCTVIVTSYDPENEFGYTMNLYVYNKADKNLYFSMENVTINGLMLDPWWSVEVAAGKRSHCTVTWSGTEMTDYNIGDVTMIGFDLSAIDSTDWESPDFADVTCMVYPMGEDAAKPFERPAQETDIVLMDNEYVTIIATNIGLDADGNYTMVLYIQNNSDSNVFLKPTNVCLNGIEIDPWWGITVTAGKATFGSISWYAFALEENSIASVETITMTMSVFDELGITTFISEEITINP